MIALLFSLLAPAAHAETLAQCWMEGDSIKCQRTYDFAGRCEAPLGTPPADPVVLSITFVNYNQTVNANIDCSGCNYSVYPFAPASASCEVQPTTTIPAGAYPVVLQLFATANGQTVVSEQRTVNSAADGGVPLVAGR